MHFILLKKFFFSCVFLFFLTIEIVCAGPTHEPPNEEPGVFEKRYMAATFKRVAELEKEGNLDVKENIRLKDNFLIKQQVRDLTNHKEALALTKRDSQWFFFQNFMYFLRLNQEKNSGRISHQSIKECRESLDNIIREKKTYPIFKPYEHIITQEGSQSEEIGAIEKNLMTTILKTIQQIQEKCSVDVDPKIRIRDNLNRADNQVRNLKADINRQIDESLFQEGKSCIKDWVKSIEKIPYSVELEDLKKFPCWVHIEKNLKPKYITDRNIKGEKNYNLFKKIILKIGGK